MPKKPDDPQAERIERAARALYEPTSGEMWKMPWDQYRVEYPVSAGTYITGVKAALDAQRPTIVTEALERYPSGLRYVEELEGRHARLREALKAISSYNADELKAWDEGNAADMVTIARDALAADKEAERNG